MSKTLVIVESPTKAKTIRRFLGKGYTVKSSMGHVRDLPRSQLGVDVENNFEPKYITIRGKGEILKNLRSEVKKCSKVLLGPDPDREGEAIAWHLKHALKLDEEQCRIEFNEITKNAISKAVKEPRPIDYQKVDAQQARRVLDRLVGYNLSPLLWKKVKKGLSAGRVQSVTVKLILDREREIEGFKPEEYWSLTAIVNKNNNSIETKLEKKNNKKIHIGSEDEVKAIIKELDNKAFIAKSVKKRERKRKPLAPFVTSTLQQEAYKRLNFTTRKTMLVAQQLYEGIDLGGKEGATGLITYIRTDSTRVSEEAKSKCKQYISEKFGADFVPKTPHVFSSPQKAQGAHEAIRPTSVFKEPETLKNNLSRDQFKLYKLIWERFVASQMQFAIMDVTTIDIAAGDYLFRASCSILRFQGFLRVYKDENEAKDDSTQNHFPEVSEGETLKLKKLSPKQHFTQPPPRYTEASLVKTLEELGIGRPSTYAPIIETILSRGYVVREDKHFHPTELGNIVIDLLDGYFDDILDVEFTANMEEKLDKVEAGELEWKEIVGEFYKPFKTELEKAEKEIGQIEVEDEITEEICEKCGRNLVVKYGRYGKFLACPGFPQCQNTKPFLEKIGVSCPLCGGMVVIRKGKKGRKFYGCSNFPDCNYISWYRPTEIQCPECKNRLVEKTAKNKQKRLVCSNKKCDYETPMPKDIKLLQEK